MRRSTRFLSAVLAASLAAAPVFTSADAWARAGSGSSWGSRGSRTYSAPPATNTAPSGAVPMQRSMTPNYGTPSPGYANPGYAGQAAPGLSRRGAFTSGLLGGLIGAGIGGMLFGHGIAGGLDGFFSFIGLLLQLALVFFLVRWLIRRFTGGGAGRPAFAGLGGGAAGRMMGGAGGLLGGLGMARQAQGSMPGSGSGGASRPAQPNLVITASDYQAFEQNLKAVQAAWSAQDMRTLQRLTSPEMTGYFNEQLSEQASRGLRNEVTNVHLDRGDLAEAWSENGRDYATVAMNFSMLDVTRDATGRVVDGDPAVRTTATELWTFVRSPGGQWMVSAIQQAR